MDITGTNEAAVRFSVELVNAWHTGCLDEAWAREATTAGRLPVLPLPAEDVDRLLPSFQRLAEDVFEIFAAGSVERAAAGLNELLRPLPMRLSLSTHGGQRAHLHFDHAGQDLSQRLRVNVLAALAGVLCDGRSQLRLGHCAAARCPRVFIDVTRSARQRFCSPGCASRTHVASHRARVASSR